MDRYEYKVVPAPERGRKAKGARSAQDRFAHALEEVMNELAREGWEYHRAETLPSEERVGLTGKTTVYRNLLVFRRISAAAVAAEPVPQIAAEAQAAPALPAPGAPRTTEAMRARGAGLRPVAAPRSAEDAAAAAAAALRTVVERPATPEASNDGAPRGIASDLVQLMGEKRKTAP